MRLRWLAFIASFLALACGARTELDDPGHDAGGGSGPQGGRDEGGMGGGGNGATGGGGMGGGGEGEGGSPPECDPETTQYIYLVTDSSELYSYFPATGAITFRGFLDCESDGATPFSMGVDRTGTAYVVYTDGELYRVSTLDGSCESTDFFAGQKGFVTFGMGFALDEAGGRDDTLYVAEITFGQTSQGLATIDTETLELNFVGPFSENPSDRIEMTSSSDGNLYGYFLNIEGTGGWVVEIDKDTATILSSTFVAAGSGPSALAFAWWGGDFYVFTSANGPTTVTRYDPDTGAVGPVASLSSVVVGAGVSTCAPGEL